MRIRTLAAVSVFALTGCSSEHHAAHTTETDKGGAQAVSYDMAVPSRDGKRIAIVKHVGSVSYLQVGSARGGQRRTIYRSPYYWISTDLYWASHDLIVFGDSNFAVNTVDVRTRRVNLRIATATSFRLSTDGRWIAWSQLGGESAPDQVGMISITGRECLPVPRPRNRADTDPFFKPGMKRLFFLRSPYNPLGGALGHSRIISVPFSRLRPRFVSEVDASPGPACGNVTRRPPASTG